MTTINVVHKNIIIIGSIGYDEKIKIDKMPEIGKTEIGNYEIDFGGKGNIKAVACARTDGETIFLGAVGDKDYETFIKHFMQEGKHRIIAYPRAGFDVDRELIDDNLEYINKASFILLQLEISFETVEYIIDKFKNEKNIILRPSPITQLERLKKLIKNVNYLILNEVELGLILEEETKTQQLIEDTSDKLMRLYQPKNVIVSLLDKGWLLRNKSEKKLFLLMM
jgi:ribokinase